MRRDKRHRRRVARQNRMREIREQMRATSEENLVTACRQAYERHDPRIAALTFTVLCEKVVRLLFWHLRRNKPNTPVAELDDYAHEFYAKLLTDIRTGRSKSYAERAFRAYMNRRLLDILRKERTRFEAVYKCVESTENVDPLEAVPSNDNLPEDTVTLQADLQQLPEVDQQIAELRLHGFTEREIALCLCISERTVRNRLQRLPPALGIARSSP